jgi:hypothetical protein
MLSFRATETALTGNQTQDIFSGVLELCVLFLVSRNKHVKFGAYRFIQSRAISQHPYKHTNINTVGYMPTISALYDLSLVRLS